MSLWFQDFHYAFRMLRKNVMLTLVIVASLAIGIGANSAIFSVVDALLLRPLPYPHPDRLAAVWLHSPGIGILRDWPSPGQYVDIHVPGTDYVDFLMPGIFAQTVAFGAVGTAVGLSGDLRAGILVRFRTLPWPGSRCSAAGRSPTWPAT